MANSQICPLHTQLIICVLILIGSIVSIGVYFIPGNFWASEFSENHTSFHF